MALEKKKSQRDSSTRYPQLRMTKEEPPVEKRQQPRFSTQFRSTFSGGQREGQGRTLDLSSGGCKIETDLPVVLGTLFELRIYIPGLDWPLRIDEAQVRWVKAKTKTVGIQFAKIRSDEKAKLQRVITSLYEECKA